MKNNKNSNRKGIKRKHGSLKRLIKYVVKNSPEKWR